jgi:hypothetical protein
MFLELHDSHIQIINHENYVSLLTLNYFYVYFLWNKTYNYKVER